MWDADRAGPSVVVAPAVVWRPKDVARVHARGSLGACLFPSLGLGFPFCTTGLLTPHQKVARKESERGQGSSPGAHLGSGCMWVRGPWVPTPSPLAAPFSGAPAAAAEGILQPFPAPALLSGLERSPLPRSEQQGQERRFRADLGSGPWPPLREPPLQAPCCWAGFGQPGSFSPPGVLLLTVGLGLDSWPCP